MSLDSFWKQRANERYRDDELNFYTAAFDELDEVGGWLRYKRPEMAGKLVGNYTYRLLMIGQALKLVGTAIEPGSAEDLDRVGSMFGMHRKKTVKMTHLALTTFGLQMGGLNQEEHIEAFRTRLQTACVEWLELHGAGPCEECCQ